LIEDAAHCRVEMGERPVSVEEKVSQAAAIPGVSPYFQVSGADKAAAFYTEAFGAAVIDRRPTDDGRLIHCGMTVNGGLVMFNDPFPEHGYPHAEPKGYAIHLQVTGIDDWWSRAIDAGCKVLMPLQDQFWGDRYGQLMDPFGVTWSMGEGKGGQA
jgi:PhnB protein